MNAPPRSRLWLTAALVLSATSVVATTVVPPTFRQLVTQAQYIVDARVVSLRCEERSLPGGSLIHTYVTIEVLKAIKGAPPPTIELRVLGGTVGDRTLEVAGVPQFLPGQRNVLFIENNGTQFCPLVAIMHGRYHVRRRGSDGAEVVLRDNGAPLRTANDVSFPMGPASAAPSGDASGAMTLTAFEQRIQTELAHATAR